MRVRVLNGLTAGHAVGDHWRLSPMITADPNKNDICLTIKLDANLSESCLYLPRTNAGFGKQFDTLSPLNKERRRSHPLAHGNGLSLLATEDVALFIPVDD